MAARHSALVSATINYIALRGGLAWKTQSGVLPVGARFVHTGRRGLPDVIGVLPPRGRMVAVEIKVGRDTPTRAQQTVHATLARLGALVVVVRDVRDIEAALRDAGVAAL